MDWLRLGRVMLKNTLEADSAYATALAWTGHAGLTKTFGKQVHAIVPLPYVTIEHYSGGPENDAQFRAGDGLWKIAVHTTDAEENDGEHQAMQLQSLITAALDGKPLVAGSVTGYKGYAPTLLVFSYEDTFPRQNRTFFKYGGIYRVRIAQTRSS